MAYTTIDNPELYFQCKLYSGNSSDGNAITLDGDENMQPNLVWIATRNTTMSKRVYDSTRGVNSAILSDTTAAADQYAAYGQFESFDSDGFTVGVGTNSDGTQGHGSNTSGHTYVAWCFKESSTAGIDVVSYTGNGSANRSISHSLGTEPDFIIAKIHSETMNWPTYSKASGNGVYFLDISDAWTNHSSYLNYWYTSGMGSSTFGVGDNDNTNKNTASVISYLFSNRQGFLKAGEYEGNNATNNFIYTGFKPAWVLIKNKDASQPPIIFDNKRDPSNLTDGYIFPSEDLAEGTSSSTGLDFLSNGFKQRNTYSSSNASNTYIYIAIAESPFVNSNGVPTNAR